MTAQWWLHLTCLSSDPTASLHLLLLRLGTGHKLHWADQHSCVPGQQPASETSGVYMYIAVFPVSLYNNMLCCVHACAVLIHFILCNAVDWSGMQVVDSSDRLVCVHVIHLYRPVGTCCEQQV